jgi:hypothetical protein
MFKKATASLILAVILLSRFSATAELKIHNIDQIPYFPSIKELTNFFSDAQVSIDVLKLNKFAGSNFILAAYPYSGLDTIDVYSFVKFGEGWKLNMVYFYLRPKYRELKIVEKSRTIILCDKNDELIRLSVDKGLNIPNR